MKAENTNLIRVIEIKDRTGRVVGSKEVVTYQGLLSKGHDEGLVRIRTTLVQIPTEENQHVAIAKAEVETSKGVFEGLGDASPENVNSFIVPHLIRMAETRAKARALRDAVNVGVTSFEELDGTDPLPEGYDPGPGGPPASGRAPRGTSRAPRRADRWQGGRTAAVRPNGPPGPMSEAQRRYLFRLLAGQGIEGQAAQDYLHDHFQVDSLSAVTREAASRLIDQLLNGSPEEVMAGGGAQR